MKKLHPSVGSGVYRAMRIAFAVLALLVLWCPDARADREINTVIGDASWAGRTEPGDEVTRIRAHLELVHALLVARDDSQLSLAQRDARAASLANLERYIERGEFPRRTSDDYEGRRPRFIDDRGVHCAVGQLIADSGHEQLARAINARFEYTHVRDMDEPALSAWASAHGFTVDELAMIQPGYTPRPTPASVREKILFAKDHIALRCARKHPLMKSLLVVAEVDSRGALRVSTKSKEPFARCFVGNASSVDRGGGAYMGSPREFSIGIDLSFTPPQKQLENGLAKLFPSCTPRPGALAREATIEITSTREAMTVRAKSKPTNALVEDCLVKEVKGKLAEFGPGEWKLYTKQRLALAPRVQLSPESLRSYATTHATECMPSPEKGARSTVTVTANPDDPAFTIVATGSPELATCMSEALNKSLMAAFRSSYNNGEKWIGYFRIDARVKTSVTIELESREARTKRLETERQRMEAEMIRIR